MILRVRYIMLTNGWVIELGGPWPGPDGKPATFKAKDPNTGQEKSYLLPAKVGSIFFIEDKSEGWPDEGDPEKQLGRGERAFYEIWAEPENDKAAELLGGKIFVNGTCTRRLKIGEQHVMICEEEWPLGSAVRVNFERAREIEEDYSEIDQLPVPKPKENSKQEAAQQSS